LDEKEKTPNIDENKASDLPPPNNLNLSTDELVIKNEIESLLKVSQ
jgi:hypothetical protein